MIATIFRNPVYDKIDLFRTGATYHRSPPNINGQFPVLHHNFYPSVELGQVYGIPPTDKDPFNLELQYGTLPGGVQHPWYGVSDRNIASRIDEGFLDCSTTEQRFALWNHTLPFILPKLNMLCSVCCCRLPAFYFTQNQRRSKRTQRTCVHCNRNRQIKIGQITQTLGAAGYFVTPRECMTCHDILPKYCFSKGRWSGTANSRVCRSCTH
eukprot:scaffold31098_cov47-Attheya_sp.AAC.1